jgi:hypothetical protein
VAAASEPGNFAYKRLFCLLLGSSGAQMCWHSGFMGIACSSVCSGGGGVCRHTANKGGSCADMGH